MWSLSHTRAAPGGGRVVELLILWGEHSVLHAAHLRPGQPFVLGDPGANEGNVDFTLPQSVVGAPTLALLEADDGATRVNVPSGAEGNLERDGQVLPLTAGSALLLAPNDQLGFQWQGFQFQVRELESADTAALHTAPAWRLAEHRWTFGSLGLHSLFLVLFQFLPSAAASLNLDESALESRLVKVHLDAQSIEPPEPLFTEDLGPDASEPGGERAPDPEGKASSPKREPIPIREPAPLQPASPALTREDLKQLARVAGINKLLLGVQGPTSNVFSDGTPGLEGGAGPFGGLIGGEGLFGGLGPIGAGRGGGGPANGTIGIDKLHTRDGMGGGPGGDLKERGPKGGPVIHRREPEVMGGLRKEVIRREIGRHLNEVRFCYEEGLRTRPELEGRITVKFAIGSTGSVLKAAVAQNELSTPGVALCIAKAVERWQFPSPEGTGTVMVSYPFVLQRP